jgi:hypothetical protein
MRMDRLGMQDLAQSLVCLRAPCSNEPTKLEKLAAIGVSHLGAANRVIDCCHLEPRPCCKRLF